jgi:hypothetical protein
MERLTIIATERVSDSPNKHGDRDDHRIRALFEPLLVHQEILRQIVDCGRGELIAAKLFDLRSPGTARDRALIRRHQLPARETLHAWDDELCAALEGKADERSLSLLLATMLDGFPRGMVPNIRTYVEGASLVLGGHSPSPEILAAAIVRTWRKDKFPPTIAGLLEECDRARQGVLNARRLVGKMIALLDNAEEVLFEAGDLGLGRKGEVR